MEQKLTVARDVGACPDCVLGTQSQTGSFQLVAALTADAARSVDLVAALTLHEVRVFWQSHWRTRLDCNTFTTTIIVIIIIILTIIIGSRPSDHYFRSVCLSVCLFVCLCRVFLSRL